MVNNLVHPNRPTHETRCDGELKNSVWAVTVQSKLQQVVVWDDARAVSDTNLLVDVEIQRRSRYAGAALLHRMRANSSPVRLFSKDLGNPQLSTAATESS